MDKSPSPELVREHLDGFVNAFVSSTQRRRWRTLLAMGEKHWAKINVGGFECNTGADRLYRAVPRADLREALRGLSLDTDIVALRLGHSREEGAVVAPLRQVLGGYDVIFEGVVSIVAGKRAIVINHDDEAILCEVR